MSLFGNQSTSGGTISLNIQGLSQNASFLNLDCSRYLNVGTGSFTSLTASSASFTSMTTTTLTATSGLITTMTSTWIFGTLATAAQSNITSVGSLTGLTVAGTMSSVNSNITGTLTAASLTTTGTSYLGGTTLYVVGGATNRVGINTTSPAYSLDVSGGGVNVVGTGNYYRIAGQPVLGYKVNGSTIPFDLDVTGILSVTSTSTLTGAVTCGGNLNVNSGVISQKSKSVPSMYCTTSVFTTSSGTNSTNIDITDFTYSGNLPAMIAQNGDYAANNGFFPTSVTPLYWNGSGYITPGNTGGTITHALVQYTSSAATPSRINIQALYVP